MSDCSNPITTHQRAATNLHATTQDPSALAPSSRHAYPTLVSPSRIDTPIPHAPEPPVSCRTILRLDPTSRPELSRGLPGQICSPRQASPTRPHTVHHAPTTPTNAPTSTLRLSDSPHHYASIYFSSHRRTDARQRRAVQIISLPADQTGRSRPSHDCSFDYPKRRDLAPSPVPSNPRGTSRSDDSLHCASWTFPSLTTPTIPAMPRPVMTRLPHQPAPTCLSRPCPALPARRALSGLTPTPRPPSARQAFTGRATTSHTRSSSPLISPSRLITSSLPTP